MSQNPNSKLKSSGNDFTPTIHNDTYDFIKPEQFDLSGRAVLITGASKGIGRAAAASFAKAGASYIGLGARSSVSATEKEVLEAASSVGKKPPQVLALELDVSNAESVQSAAAGVTKAFDRLDILINNAGYLPDFAPIVESEVDEWWRVYEVNVRGVYLVTRAFLPLMLKDGMKTILNMSSVGANLNTPGASAYIQATNLIIIYLLTASLGTHQPNSQCKESAKSSISNTVIRACFVSAYTQELLSRSWLYTCRKICTVCLSTRSNSVETPSCGTQLSGEVG